MPTYTPRLHEAAEKALQASPDITGREVAGQGVEAHQRPADAQPDAVPSFEGPSHSTGPSLARFAAVYAKPEQASDRWVQLSSEIGIPDALDRVRTTPGVLGTLHGWTILGVESASRRDAAAQFTDLITELRTGLDDEGTAQPQATAPHTAEHPRSVQSSEADALRRELDALRLEYDQAEQLQREAQRRMAENQVEEGPPRTRPELGDDPKEKGSDAPDPRRRPQDPEPER